jgi:transcriptional regulator with XRE-family HTH domain
MSWKTDLGQQIRRARKAAKKSQEALSAEITGKLALPRPFSHAQISNIENGKSATAVNIITAIAEILDAEFELGGCKIGRPVELVPGQLTVMPKQLCLPFNVELSFSTSLKLTSLPEGAFSLQAVIKGGQTKPVRTIEVGASKANTA